MSPDEVVGRWAGDNFCCKTLLVVMFSSRFVHKGLFEVEKYSELLHEGLVEVGFAHGNSPFPVEKLKTA